MKIGSEKCLPFKRSNQTFKEFAVDSEIPAPTCNSQSQIAQVVRGATHASPFSFFLFLFLDVFIKKYILSFFFSCKSCSIHYIHSSWEDSMTAMPEI